SQNEGESWSLIYPKLSSVKGIKMSSDHSDEDLIAEPNPLGSITAMAIDPSDSRTFYVAAGDRRKSTFALFTSRDGGENWVRVVERCERSRRACAIRARPMFPTEIWKKVESNGWGLPRPPMQGAIGNWFGRRTAIPLPGLPRISMTHGSRNDLDRIGAKTPWRLP